MSRVILSLLIVPVVMLASCRTVQPQPQEYLAPRIDCAAFEVPRAEKPEQPPLTENSVVIWQLYGWGWQAYAEDVLMQRVETAVCLKRLRDAGIIR